MLVIFLQTYVLISCLEAVNEIIGTTLSLFFFPYLSFSFPVTRKLK